MRHLIGGFFMGVAFGVCFCKGADTSKGWVDVGPWMVAVLIWGCIFAGMTWGLWP